MRQMFYKMVFLKYKTRQIKATETNMWITYLNYNGSLIQMIEMTFIRQTLFTVCCLLNTGDDFNNPFICNYFHNYYTSPMN